jgi:hypothetical protein
LSLVLVDVGWLVVELALQLLVKSKNIDKYKNTWRKVLKYCKLNHQPADLHQKRDQTNALEQKQNPT